MKSLITLFSMLVFTFSVFSQTNKSHWVEFSHHTRLTADQVALTQKQQLGLRLEEALLKKSSETDQIGGTHHRYQQTYKDIPIEGAIYLIHEKQGLARRANGHLVRGILADATPNLTEEEALAMALASVNAQQYAWQSEATENTMKAVKGDPNASFYPQAELVWVAPYFFENAEVADYRLAYKFDIYAIRPHQRKYVYIDAKMGNIITKISRLHDSSNCQATSNYACSNPINIKVDTLVHPTTGATYYTLIDNDRGGGIETFSNNNLGGGHTFYVLDTNCPFDADPTSSEVHWATEQTFDYFKNEHNRNSFDGNNAKVLSLTHYDADLNNASWNGTWLVYGDGSGNPFTSLTAVDVVAHEFSHAVTDNSADLIYFNEPGALNESFSDIFGTVVEFYADPTCADWLIGEDFTVQTNKTCLRNMANPNDVSALTQQPDTYLGTYWYTGNGDNGGVHYNSGVQNYWFYLLSEGGSGMNDNGDTYNITGIGMEKAAKIAYLNLTAYLTPISQYVDARNGSIQAAADLYGATSLEVAAVTDAWCAVGVGTCSLLPPGTITVTAPNGGELWQYGTTEAITWTHTGNVTDVNIEYSTDNGVNWIYLATMPNTNTYNWTIPNQPTPLALVRVTDVNNPTVYDVSDLPFNIQGCNIVAGFTHDLICVDELYTFINTSNLSNGVVFEWHIDGVSQGNVFNLDHTFSQVGTYEIVLNAVYGACTDSYTQIVTVEDLPTATFTYTTNELEISCTADELNATEYAWIINSPTIESTTATLNYTFPMSGTYEVCLEIQATCTTTYCELVTVEELNECGEGGSNEVNASYTLSGNRCIDQSLTFTNTSTNATTAQWLINGVLQSTAANLTHTFTQAGTYAVMLIATNGICTDNYTQTIHIQSTPTGGFNSVNNGLDYTFTADNAGASSYDWTIDGSAISGNSQSINHTFFTGGNYNVCLTEGTQGCGSSGANCMVLTVTGTIACDSEPWTLFTNGNYIQDVLKDGDYLWICTQGGGLVKYNLLDGSFVTFNSDNSDMPHTDVDVIIKSSSGYYYVGTWEGGVAKFDGVNPYGWTIFNTSNSPLLGGNIKDIMETSNNEIILATWGGGISIFEEADPSNWINFTAGNSDLPSNWTTSLVQSNTGDIFMGVNGGLAKLDDTFTNWEVFLTDDSDLPDSNVRSLLASSSGDIFVGTRWGGLAKFDGSNRNDWEIYNTSSTPNLSHNTVSSLFENSNQEVFAGGYSGFAKFNGSDFSNWTTFTTSNSDLTSNRIEAFLEKDNGNMLVGTFGGGIAEFDGISTSGWNYYYISTSDLPFPTIKDVVESSTGEVFLATGGGGLVKFDGESPTDWIIFNTASSDLPHNDVHAIVESSTGSFYIGTNAGLAKFDGTNTGSWDIFNTTLSGLPQNRVESIVESSTGEFWVATYGGGVAKFDGTSTSGWDIYNTSSGLPSDSVISLFESSDGAIWVGTISAGLAKFDGTTWTTFNTINSDLPHNRVEAILESSTGNMFVGTWGGGLAKFDATNPTNTWTIFDTGNSDIQVMEIYSLMESNTGEVYVGTYWGGLSVFDGSNHYGWTTHITANEALPYNQVLSIAERSTGEIYAGTTSGLGLYNPIASLFEAVFTTELTNCASQATTFTNMSSPTATDFEWYIDGNFVASTEHLDYTFSTAGTYTVTLTTTDGICTDTYEQQVTINNSVLNLDLGADVASCDNSLEVMSGISDATYYLWEFEGMVIGTTPTLTAMQSGLYSLSVGDVCGNTALDSIYVTLDSNCVWPGDFNYDNVVNNYDLLAWGIAFGAMGSNRPNASFNMEGQPCIDWSGVQPDSTNYKHCDGNGDGIIGINDYEVIELNYGQMHGTPTPSASPPTGPISLTPVLATPPALFGNNTLIAVEFHLDNSINAMTATYGLAFTIDYLLPTMSAVNILDVRFAFTNSSIGIENVDMQTVQRHYQTSATGGRIEVAMSRMDHTNVNGTGVVGVLIAEIDLVTSTNPITMETNVNDVQLTTSDGNTITVGSFQNTLNIAPGGFAGGKTLQPKILLEGAYNPVSSTMTTELSNSDLLSLVQPYHTNPWNYDQATSIENWTDMPPNVVDWVLIELRNAQNPEHTLHRRAALLLNDGTIREPHHLTEGIRFATLADNSEYYVVIRHRNHIDLITAEPVTFHNTDPVVVDFTNPATVMGGAAQLQLMNDGQYAMLAGDFNGDGFITAADLNLYSSQSSVLNDYNHADANLDKNVTIADFNFYDFNGSKIGASPITY